MGSQTNDGRCQQQDDPNWQRHEGASLFHPSHIFKIKRFSNFEVFVVLKPRGLKTFTFRRYSFVSQISIEAAVTILSFLSSYNFDISEIFNSKTFYDINIMRFRVLVIFNFFQK